ncbi:hypothetical protein BDV27DRAFT_147007 [Aspergillus caelatus]|uniref:Uncharacterized protein n=2 Tax=Aspergillus subgen. Circumdati TaxID=2720871 RepID=A0A5N6ZXP2_9EURO|nr:uncharacterized protein BDV27DRAFT_147007 [Aspergillus caelatus]KAE8362381.1 hypothetical protein BDV27DRAFT_147007 [Aspergillus caelatus]KAE8410726.1 hypothetical protein BDV36DRAFT_289343 [Aspergillus pseudocaelatus]
MVESPEVSCASSIQSSSDTSEDAARKVVLFPYPAAGYGHVPIMGVILPKPLTNILVTIGEENGLDPWVKYDRPPLEPPKNVNVSARYRRSTPALIGNKNAGGTSRSIMFRISSLVG